LHLARTFYISICGGWRGGGARNRVDTPARVAKALNRHLVVSFPEQIPVNLADAVLVA
jgi:hypothetical protein